MTYRIALLADEYPYISSSPTWGTYETLKLAGHIVEVLDTIRFPGVIKAGRQYDQEMLAPFIRRFNPDYIAFPGETANDILRHLEQGCARDDSLERPRRFVIFGYIGKDNFGDELIFSLIVRALLRRYPGAHISLIGHDPTRALERHGVVSVLPFDKSAQRAMLNGADALIFMAGIIFDDPVLQTSGLIDLFQNPYGEIAGQTALVELAHMCNVQSFFLGIGAGPLCHPDSQCLVELGSLCKPIYITRDEHTSSLLEAAGVPESLISTKADMAFLIDPEEFAQSPSLPIMEGSMGRDGYMVISLRDCDRCDEDFCNNIAEALDEVYERRSLTPLFLNFAPEDAVMHASVIARMRHGHHTKVYETLDTDETLRILAGARLVLGMRLHASILSTIFSVPTVGLNYNDKVEAFYYQMGIESQLAPLSFDPSVLSDMLLKALDSDTTAIAEKVARNRRLALEGFDLLYADIDSNSNMVQTQWKYPRIVSNDALALFALRDERESLIQELARSKRRIEALESSTTWKVGRIMTVLPRGIKSLISGLTSRSRP